DVDERVVGRMITAVSKEQERKPAGAADFRKALDDKNIDVLVCAAPNHCHAPATILGCSAGKQVYREKPSCHNPREGELAGAGARWGLGVDYQSRVTSGGGKYRHDDDQETPATHMVTYNFPGKKSILWEGLSWSPYGPEKNGFGISFHGEKGTIVLDGSSYKMFDLQNKEVGGKSA